MFLLWFIILSLAVCAITNVYGNISTEDHILSSRAIRSTCDNATGELQCQHSNITICLNASRSCDGKRDCDGGEDENRCANTTCPAGKFKCFRSSEHKCIPDVQRCNGNPRTSFCDCEGGEDEENCRNVNLGQCKVFQKLVERGIQDGVLQDWVCLVRYTSNYVTGNYGGIFRISSDYWCGPGKGCNISCDALQDADITDDIECAKFIQKISGFGAFPEWRSYCHYKAERRVFVDPCLPVPGQKFPKITVSAQDRNVSFVNSTENQKLTCSATGYPLPNIKWSYNHTAYPDTFVVPGELPYGRPAKEVTISLYFRNTKNIKAVNKFECVASNLVGEAKLPFYIQLKEPDLPSRFPYEIVGPALVLLIIIIIILTVVIHRKYFMRTGLTDAEIEEFIRGNPNRFNFGGNPQDDANSHPYDNKFELVPAKLQIYTEEVIGKGEFGIIYKGKYDNKTVAIKTVSLHAEKSYIIALLNELKVMIYIGEHSGIVNLIGAETSQLRKGVVNIAVEFCEMGDLANFLRKNVHGFGNSLPDSTPQGSHSYQNVDVVQPKVFTTNNLLDWSAQIVSAMEHLESKRVVHGDLAARNVLLFNKYKVKLTDFGLSKRLYEYTQYIKKGQVPLPWSWMAYESLTRRIFTIQSDIWSFGVTMYELFSLGDVPYPGLSWSIDFPSQLEKGLRPQKPKFANDEIYGIMMRCWNINPDARPGWKDIYQNITNITT